MPVLVNRSLTVDRHSPQGTFRVGTLGVELGCALQCLVRVDATHGVDGGLGGIHAVQAGLDRLGGGDFLFREHVADPGHCQVYEFRHA